MKYLLSLFTWPNFFKLIFLAFLIILEIQARIKFINFESYDYLYSLSAWYNFILTHGNILALKYNFADYNLPYLYILAIGSYFSIYPLYLIKIVSITFDFVLIFSIFKIIRLKYKNFYVATSLAFFGGLLPTIIINSSMWGQADSIFTSFLLLGIYFLIKRQLNLFIVFFSIALGFKLQAIFLAPVMLMLFYTNKINIKQIFIIPYILIGLVIPAVIVGRPILDALFIYIHQIGENNQLTMNAPNIYQWISNDYFSTLQVLGVIVTAIIIILLIWILKKKNILLDNMDNIVRISTLFVLLLPLFLPKMHERYFYPADVLTFIYGIYFPKRIYLFISLQIASLLSYIPFLNNETPVSFIVLPIFVIIPTLIVLFDIFKYSNTNKKPLINNNISLKPENG